MKKILIILLFLPLVCSAEIYKYIDEKGNIYYTDQPQPGANKIQLQPTTVTRKNDDVLNAKAGAKISAKKGVAEEEKKEVVKVYNSFNIADPANQQTFQNTRLIPVTLKVEPVLFEGDQIVVLLDGQEVTKPQASNQFIINNPERGTHTVSAKIINATGQTIKTSNAVTIYVHYSTLNNPTRSNTNGN